MSTFLLCPTHLFCFHIDTRFHSQWTALPVLSPVSEPRQGWNFSDRSLRCHTASTAFVRPLPPSPPWSKVGRWIPETFMGPGWLGTPSRLTWATGTFLWGSCFCQLQGSRKVLPRGWQPVTPNLPPYGLLGIKIGCLWVVFFWCGKGVMLFMNKETMTLLRVCSVLSSVLATSKESWKSLIN